jgi:methylamine utilization protein MauE
VVTADALAPFFFLAAGLLVVSGAVKQLQPRATAQSMLDAGLPGSIALARGIGAIEIAIGIWALAAPSRGGAIALAALYASFSVFLVHVLREHPDAGSCGCAGPTPVPPSRVHLALDLVVVVSALAFAFSAPVGVVDWLAAFGWLALPVAFGLGLAGWLAVVAATRAPAAFRAWQPPAHEHDLEPHGHDHAVADSELALVGIEPGHPSLWPGVKGDAG